MLRIGHRGAAGHAPENTLLSLNRALELQVDVVEIDVQRTRDGQLVLMHDKRVNRTTNGKGYVKELRYAEVCALDAGNGQSPPSLRHAIELVNGAAQLMVELIDPAIVPDVVRLVDDLRCWDEIIFASFHHRAVQQVRRMHPAARTLALAEGIPVNYSDFAKAANVTHVGLSLDSLTEEFVAVLRGERYKVFVYTVNDEDDIRRLIEMPVDGIISDYPERIPKS